MPVLASAATTVAVCTMVLGKSPGRVMSAQFGAAATCCARMAQVAASAPHNSHFRVIRIVIPPLERTGVLRFVLQKKTYNDPAVNKSTREQKNLTIALGIFYRAEQMPRGDFLGSLEQIVMLAVMRLG